MTVPPAPRLAFAAATDTGLVREANEDNFVLQPMVFAVADGMGGHAAGEVASEIAAATLRDRLRDGAASVDLMVAAVVEANAAIFQAAHSHSDQRGMGTTVVAIAALTDEAVVSRLVLANVGDSRAYLFRDGVLERLSIDHSYVQELVSTGHITESEARTHPRRNIVTRALGIEPTVKVDTWVHPLVTGDRYLLCSDGLVDEVDDPAIAEVLGAEGDPHAAADALVAAANINGGHDNTTVVVIDVLEGAAEAPVQLAPTWQSDQPRMIDADERSTPSVIGNPQITVQSDDGAEAARWGTRRTSRRRMIATLIAAAAVLVALVVAFLVAGNGGEQPVDSTSTVSSTIASTTVVEPGTTDANAVTPTSGG